MRIRQIATSSLAVVMLLAAAPSWAQKLVPSSNRGAVQLGLRLGYGAPFGKLGTTATAMAGNDLSFFIKGQVPVAVDAGYLVNPNVYVGLLFQYGFGFTGSGDESFCNQSGISCSTTDLTLGVGVHYHLSPAASFDPWIGLGVGYEWLAVTATGTVASESFSSSGFQYVNLQVGVDVSVAPNIAAGPFVSFSAGQYASVSNQVGNTTASQNITNQSFHEWLLFGVRGVYNVKL